MNFLYNLLLLTVLASCFDMPRLEQCCLCSLQLLQPRQLWCVGQFQQNLENRHALPIAMPCSPATVMTRLQKSQHNVQNMIEKPCRHIAQKAIPTCINSLQFWISESILYIFKIFMVSKCKKFSSLCINHFHFFQLAMSSCMCDWLSQIDLIHQFN